MSAKLFIRWLWASLDVGLGRSYGIGDGKLNCVVFVISVLRAMYPALDWTTPHRVLHLDGQPVGSLANTAKLVEMGVGVETVDASEKGVYVAQGWRGGSGHCIFLVRRRNGLYICDFSPADCDGLEPVEWADIVRRWPSRMLVKLSE